MGGRTKADQQGIKGVALSRVKAGRLRGCFTKRALKPQQVWAMRSARRPDDSPALTLTLESATAVGLEDAGERLEVRHQVIQKPAALQPIEIVGTPALFRRLYKVAILVRVPRRAQ